MEKRVKVTVLMDDLAGKAPRIKAHHGLSFLFDIAYPNGDTFSMIMDTGTIGEDLLHNMRVLDIQPESIDTCMITHKHYDHAGGLSDVLKNREMRLPVFLNKDCFVPAFSKTAWKYAGFPASKERLELLGANFISVDEPVEVAPECYISGRVKNVEKRFQRALGHTRIKDGRPEPEEHQEELNFYIVEGDSVHVFSGCSHRGIVNICHDALEKTGSTKLGVVMGGFHFTGASISEIEQHITALEELKPVAVLSGHCTGFTANALLFRRFGKQFNRFSAGDRFNLIRD